MELIVLNRLIRSTIHSLTGGATCLATASLFNQTDKLASLGITTPKLFLVGAVFTACHQQFLPNIQTLVTETATSGALAVLIKGFDAPPRDLIITCLAIFALNTISIRLYNATGLKDALNPNKNTRLRWAEFR